MRETPGNWQHAGKPAAEVIAELDFARSNDVDWRAGRTNFYVQYGGVDVEHIAREASNRFLLENGHGGRAFPSLRQFEDDIVGWSLELLGGAGGTGCLTSGGSESILIAMKVARDRATAKRPN
ncbi:MAG: aspartate aminotransferase family protein, partial [Methylobacterium sp.]|nr:aspartate aminotransferase family protein [Methylobacterium sp.]